MIEAWVGHGGHVMGPSEIATIVPERSAMPRQLFGSAKPDGPTIAIKGVLGGFLMGLANLVPGISGGTMLLAVGIYPQFIRGVAEVSTFRFSARSLLLLGCVACAAAVSIVGLAGIVKDLVVDHRWIMYSLFIGLTLGGVPVLWRLLSPVDSTVVVGSIVGVAAMVALAVTDPGGAAPASTDANRVMAMLVLAGIAGGSAMILPGISGGYVLLILGQYVVILSAIDSATEAVAQRDWGQLGQAMRVFIPVGLGMMLGIVAVSNLIKLLLDRFEKATLGVLLGLLLGAVVGLWPFQRPGVPVGDLAVRAIGEAEFFAPSAAEVAVSLGLIVAGFALSTAVSHLGRNTDAGGR